MAVVEVRRLPTEGLRDVGLTQKLVPEPAQLTVAPDPPNPLRTSVKVSSCGTDGRGVRTVILLVAARSRTATLVPWVTLNCGRTTMWSENPLSPSDMKSLTAQ